MSKRTGTTAARNAEIISALKKGVDAELLMSRHKLAKETIRWILRVEAPDLVHVLHRKKDQRCQGNKEHARKADIKEMFERFTHDLYYLKQRDVLDIVGRNFNLSRSAVAQIVKVVEEMEK